MVTYNEDWYEIMVKFTDHLIVPDLSTLLNSCYYTINNAFLTLEMFMHVVHQGMYFDKLSNSLFICNY